MFCIVHTALGCALHRMDRTRGVGSLFGIAVAKASIRTLDIPIEKASLETGCGYVGNEDHEFQKAGVPSCVWCYGTNGRLGYALARTSAWVEVSTALSRAGARCRFFALSLTLHTSTFLLPPLLRTKHHICKFLPLTATLLSTWRRLVSPRPLRRVCRDRGTLERRRSSPRCRLRSEMRSSSGRAYGDSTRSRLRGNATKMTSTSLMMKGAWAQIAL